MVKRVPVEVRVFQDDYYPSKRGVVADANHLNGIIKLHEQKNIKRSNIKVVKTAYDRTCSIMSGYGIGLDYTPSYEDKKIYEGKKAGKDSK